MQRIIDGKWFNSNPADFVRLVATETHNGHIEVTAYTPDVWHESGDCHPGVREWTAQELESKVKASTKRSAQSARKGCRFACKSIGADSLITLTYRANQTDVALCKQHLKEFYRRVARLWPDFQFVAAFEQQKRGAYHAHLATNKLPFDFKVNGSKVKSYDLLRSVWRSVTGTLGGNVDVQKKRRNSAKSPARIAAYLSKYLNKAFDEGIKFSNRWCSYGKVKRPVRVQLGQFPTMKLAMIAAHGLLLDTQTVVSSFLRDSGNLYWLAAELWDPDVHLPSQYR